MAEFIRHKKMPRGYRIVATGDWHIGSRACHMVELQRMLEWIGKSRDVYWLHTGDMIEGNPVRSKHFDLDTLDPVLSSIGAQVEKAVELVRPVAGKCLMLGVGNHDIYLKPDVDIPRLMAKDMGVPKGGYQTWLHTGGVRGHIFHGRRSMPKGAKDPIQRDANQRAWLARELDNLGAADSHYHLMGHVHTLHVQPPIRQYALVSEGDELRARWITPPAGTGTDAKNKQAYSFVPKEARWFACCGTFRRSGIMGAEDYAEIAGFAPAPIGYQVLTVKDDVLVDISPVIP